MATVFIPMTIPPYREILGGGGRSISAVSKAMLVAMRLECAVATFLVANSDRVVDSREENLAVADLAGARRL